MVRKKKTVPTQHGLLTLEQNMPHMQSKIKVFDHKLSYNSARVKKGF